MNLKVLLPIIIVGIGFLFIPPKAIKPLIELSEIIKSSR